MTFKNGALRRVVDFLRDVGMEVELECGADGFLKGCQIKGGRVLVDPRCEVDVVLHEAGHLAIIPPEFRPTINDDVEQALVGAAAVAWGVDLDPDHPIRRALLQCGDTEATAWAWAAGLEAGVEERRIIRKRDYGGSGVSIRLALRVGCYAGIHGLAHAGMCRLPQSGGFPKMEKWLQDARCSELAP
jgi:hypothetical protein